MLIQDHIIYKIIKDQGGSATKKQIFDAFEDDEETKRLIEERLRVMERFGILTVDGDEVRIEVGRPS